MEMLWYCVVVILPTLCLAVSFDENYIDTASFSEEEEERECHGTSVGFGYSGTLLQHYQALRKRYAGCTYVHGNVEITNLDDPVLRYDLDFLSSIRYVSGYVLIGLSTQVEEIPLTSLEVIRGNYTYRVQGQEYALVVALTSRDSTPVMGLRHLYMPKLKEISRGKVMFSQNPLLSHMSTVAWDIITRGRPDSLHLADKAFQFKDETCADECTLDGNGLCWGDSPRMCQELAIQSLCAESCAERGMGWRCFGPGDDQCCHPNCAVGCTGPGPQDCLVCMDYMLEPEVSDQVSVMDGADDMKEGMEEEQEDEGETTETMKDNRPTCVGFCPDKTYPKLQTCVRF